MFAVDLCCGIWDGRVPLMPHNEKFSLSHCRDVAPRALANHLKFRITVVPLATHHPLRIQVAFSWIRYRCHFHSKKLPPCLGHALNMRSITRCLCSCTVWTSALWGQGSWWANCFKMATGERVHRADVFYRNFERDVCLKAEKIR